jgi:hypothetical protein
MKFSKWSLIALIIVALSAALGLGLIAADDSQPEPGTPEDNACYDGGLMAGKCDTDWEWNGGWYLARFLTGSITRQEVPVIYESLLPPLEVVEEIPVLTICKSYGWEAHEQLCASSNQTGVWESTIYGPYTYLIFTPDSTGASCPATFNGFGISVRGSNTMDELSPAGFTSAEAAQLGLNSFACVYRNK